MATEDTIRRIESELANGRGLAPILAELVDQQAKLVAQDDRHRARGAMAEAMLHKLVREPGLLTGEGRAVVSPVLAVLDDLRP